MRPPRLPGAALLAGALAMNVTATAGPPATPASASTAGVVAATFAFAGKSYVHRWSHAGQHEFTPAAQPDLSTWQDMVTLQLYDKVANPDELALVANGVLVAYLKSGQVLRSTLTRAAPDQPAEQLVVALLQSEGVRELMFARFRLAPEGGGEAIIYSHRVYGAQPDDAAGDWLRAHGAATEQAMTAWTDIPSAAALRTLPQSP
jgi:hypothetical protein